MCDPQKIKRSEFKARQCLLGPVHAEDSDEKHSVKLIGRGSANMSAFCLLSHCVLSTWPKQPPLESRSAVLAVLPIRGYTKTTVGLDGGMTGAIFAAPRKV